LYKKSNLLIAAILLLACILPALSLVPAEAQTTYTYTFNGLIDETRLTPVNTGANVTVIYSPQASHAPDNFITPSNGSPYTYTTNAIPLYFLYDLSNYYGYNVTRQYWLDPDETSGTYTVYSTLPNLQSISFIIRALGGVEPGQYIQAELVSVQGTQAITARSLIDQTNTAQLSLRPESVYRITLTFPDGTKFSFGNVVVSTSAITLTISPMSFSQETIWQYQYVRLTASKPTPDTIRVNYEDLLGGTISAQYNITDQQGSIVFTMLYDNTVSFSDLWIDASPSAVYFLTAQVNHAVFGQLTFEQTIGGDSSANAQRIDLAVFGNFMGIPTEQIVAAIIILVVFGVFSAINAYIGLFVGVAASIFLWWIGWLTLNTGVFVASFCLVILLAITYWKRRGG
jgi:hypothetical protein